jgi:hypothetical protein
MEYKKDLMPITCGAYNSLPVPFQQGTHQAMPTQHTMTASHMTPSQQMMPFQQMALQQITPSPQAMPAMPTGMPAGTPIASPVSAGPAGIGVANHSSQIPVTVESTLFTPGFLRTQIGRRIRVEFLLGTNLLTDRTGTLIAVGASYILLRLIDSDDLMMCDIYSIKFVTIIL